MFAVLTFFFIAVPFIVTVLLVCFNKHLASKYYNEARSKESEYIASREQVQDIKRGGATTFVERMRHFWLVLSAYVILPIMVFPALLLLAICMDLLVLVDGLFPEVSLYVQGVDRVSSNLVLPYSLQYTVPQHNMPNAKGMNLNIPTQCHMVRSIEN